ncbi:ornithine carbamoyltransferase [Kroppenstedtia eburnea]|uniref:Ornithine carbamoyltransferase n=1 Tax=Kroppenstedtia eburnea TaxID=714067 RepID=A0A1N7JTK3_9BACL|nr:ornithine carbamoyltransferase [Kroppenstedtia eburnea]EGK10641.1 ornithine carbamoyltransferase [Desmospora sp. 8437]QKI83438.1 ornithine carbamoyltransferase [Kroppenstedtia eburnea]SIS52657.1 ornithine carbamoyltransferase [Kroppenstedtia eburnea]
MSVNQATARTGEISTLSPLQGRDCLTLLDFTPREIQGLVDEALGMKQAWKEGKADRPLTGKTLAMIFDKPSTRTRISFETGMAQLGGHPLHLNRGDLQLGRGESLPDTARVLSGYVDAVLIRTFSHEAVEELARHASIPIINGLTDLHHPCQALADLLTLKESRGRLAGLTLAYIGDGNNMLHSLLEAAAATGIHLRAATPQGYEPDPAIIRRARKAATRTGADLYFTSDPREAATGADAIYTDVWASMGQEEEKERRIRDFAGFQVDPALMSLAKPDALFMHCLPAYRGLEVSAEVIDGPRSIVFPQAENRLHAQKALLAALIG